MAEPGRFDAVSKRPLRFRRYPAYRDSGVEWLGEIPAHWDAARMWRISRAISGGTPAKDERAYWNGEIPWVSPKDMKRRIIDSAEDTITERAIEETSLRLVPPPVVLIVVRGMILAHSFPVAMTTVPVTINQDMKALVLGDEIDPRYMVWVLEGVGNEIRAAIVEEAAHGTRAIRMDEWRTVAVPVPPDSEQRSIVAFLERETAKIDELVAKKERLIELLQEKRSALIASAVTRGLDRNLPTKDPGVEWLRKMPSHWECRTLAHLTILRCDGPFGSALKSEHYSDGGVRVVRLQNIGFAAFLDTDRAFIPESYARRLGNHDVVEGDLLIAGLGDEGHPVGRACVAPSGIAPAMVKADCFRFRLNLNQVSPRFAAYLLSATARAAAGSLATGATRERMNLTTMAARKVALPPLDEQRVIALFLDQETARIDLLVVKIREAIRYLQELRTALISAAVTGKIDVREEAAA